MVIDQKIQQWRRLLEQTDEAYIAEKNPEEPSVPYRVYGEPLKPPIQVPIWNSNETVPASPMLESWFSPANGWSEYTLGRRALSIAEMENPLIGSDFYLTPQFDDGSSRHRFVAELIQEEIPQAVQYLEDEPSYLSLKNPKVAIFSLPLLSSVVGAELLVFSPELVEPIVFLNDFEAKDLEAMLDEFIGSE